jgi:hypothetical protein
MSRLKRVFALVFLLTTSLLSQACYLSRDASGQWWACEDYLTANGDLSGCIPIESPF